MTQKYSSLEIFAGCGGTALGLEQAGFKHVALIEKNRDCVSTLNKNRPNWNIIYQDIRTVDYSDISADIISGGFPCQPFSHAGNRKGLADIRGTLALSVLDQTCSIHRVTREQGFKFRLPYLLDLIKSGGKY